MAKMVTSLNQIQFEIFLDASIFTGMHFFILKKSSILFLDRHRMRNQSHKMKCELSLSGEDYTYGGTALDFSYNDQLKLSNFVQNYAKIENAFSIDLTGVNIEILNFTLI